MISKKYDKSLLKQNLCFAKTSMTTTTTTTTTTATTMTTTKQQQKCFLMLFWSFCGNTDDNNGKYFSRDYR